MRLHPVLFSALERIDRDILGGLLGEGRMTFRDLAELVRLSSNAVADRVRSLERRGVIRGYHADVDLTRLGLTLTALIDVKLGQTMPAAQVEARLAEIPEVLEVLHVTGAPDYVLRVACADVAGLDRLIGRLVDEVGVQSTDTRVILRTVC
ncbi:Lrp/AsnC family transcriptional regulator [Spongiactinospora sp. TRM90649]|uniref:Lrp/AsnC family transcriptional regulator n=1 Tax=Spongiactinospora sp. TRM90649 TaxID=3031114 RepID=UPI0023F8C54E|nr:Lrp/AsnC family transcriptional regulator [Spongiactinospora sp. TRM90649]MDF5756330.1 Lrp/AsnC family transcriptional regulator [Spongiactinospora sp. TRM90649]